MLDVARKKVADVTEELEQAREYSKQRIAEIYAELVAQPECSIGDVDQAKLSESLLRENIAALQGELVAAKEVEQKASQEVAEAAKEVVKQTAANEAIVLLTAEQQRDLRLAQQKKDDEIVDEVAEVQAARKNR